MKYVCAILQIARSCFLPCRFSFSFCLCDFDVRQHPDEIEVTIRDKSPVPHSACPLWEHLKEKGEIVHTLMEKGGPWIRDNLATVPLHVSSETTLNRSLQRCDFWQPQYNLTSSREHTLSQSKQVH